MNIFNITKFAFIAFLILFFLIALIRIIFYILSLIFIVIHPKKNNEEKSKTPLQKKLAQLGKILGIIVVLCRRNSSAHVLRKPRKLMVRLW